MSKRLIFLKNWIYDYLLEDPGTLIGKTHTKGFWDDSSVQFSSVQSLSRVQLFATPWTTAHQASLSITNSGSLPKLMSIESVMPSSQTFVVKVMSLLFNMLSRLVITFLPRSKRLLISWLQSTSAVILEPQNIVSHCFPIYLPWSDGTRCHDLRFLNVEL